MLLPHCIGQDGTHQQIQSILMSGVPAADSALAPDPSNNWLFLCLLCAHTSRPLHMIPAFWNVLSSYIAFTPHFFLREAL